MDPSPPYRTRETSTGSYERVRERRLPTPRRPLAPKLCEAIEACMPCRGSGIKLLLPVRGPETCRDIELNSVAKSSDWNMSMFFMCMVDITISYHVFGVGILDPRSTEALSHTAMRRYTKAQASMGFGQRIWIICDRGLEWFSMELLPWSASFHHRDSYIGQKKKC